MLGEPTAAALETECRAKYKGYLQDGTVAAPTPAAVDACRAYLTQIVCGPTVDTFEPSACTATLEGTVGASVFCEIDEQCRGDAYCKRGGPETCGNCQARAPGAAPCAGDHECTSGCAALAGTGGACDSAAYCSGQLECVAGLCATGPATTGTACAGDTDCAPLLSCIGGTCAKNEMTGTYPAY